jgi:multidrug resistance efflux pump
LLAALAVLSGCGGDIAVESGEQAVRDSVAVTGELQSSNSYFFGPPAIPDIWNYTIAFMAPDGSFVEAGRPILRFDTQELMTKLRDKRNQLNEKQKELEKARIVAREQLAELGLQVEEAKAARDKARLKAEIPENLLAAREFRENQLLLEQSELQYALKGEELAKERIVQRTEVEILEREVGVLEVETGRLQGSIDSMTMKAPAPGVVIHVRDRRGNKLDVGDNVWGGRRVIEFPDLEQLEARLEIPERESTRVSVGQPVRLRLDALPDREFTGQILTLGSVIHTRSTTQPDKVFDATVKLLDPDTELMRPGMNVSARILLEAGDELAAR